jgi:hypothetical protein
VLTVLRKVAGVFGTGIGSDALGRCRGGSHYQLILNANDPTAKDVVVSDSTVLPGVWVANSSTRSGSDPGDPIANAGNYAYRTTFDLGDLIRATALLKGSWPDDLGTDIC